MVNKRLLNLEKIAIERYNDEIEHSSEMDICDVIIKHLVSGDFNEDFISEYLPSENKKSIMELVNQYSGLCFYDQNCEYWLDSISERNIGDYRTVLFMILENYDFLIRLATSGGKKVLDELSNYVDCAGYCDSSVIDYLRCGFNKNDDVALHILLDMVSNDKYSIFSEEQRACLLAFPLGVLYKYNGEDIEYVSPEVVAKNINEYMQKIEYFGDDQNMNTLVGLANTLRKIPDFQHVVSTISSKYQDIHTVNEELMNMFKNDNTYIVNKEHKNKIN